MSRDLQRETFNSGSMGNLTPLMNSNSRHHCMEGELHCPSASGQEASGNLKGFAHSVSNTFWVLSKPGGAPNVHLWNTEAGPTRFCGNLRDRIITPILLFAYLLQMSTKNGLEHSARYGFPSLRNCLGDVPHSYCIFPETRKYTDLWHHPFK